MVEPSPPSSMKWASALSTRPSLEAAVDEVIAATQADLGAPADLALVFISSTFASEYPRLLPLLQERLPVAALIGCGAGGIVGNRIEQIGKIPLDPEQISEIEDEPALALCLASLPGVSVKAFWLDEEELPDLDSPPQAWVDYVGVPPETRPEFILIADPFTSQISDLLQGLDFAYPASIKVGGMASGGTANRANGLFCNDQYYEEGTVGVALSGNITIKAVVAQGCRPVGPIFRVIEGERNIILQIEEELGDRPLDASPLEALQGLLRELTEDDRELAQHSLFVGVAYSEFQTHLEQGNFLIRSLVGIDPRVGAVAIGDRVRPGQRIQFHLRDAEAATRDLERCLEQHSKAMGNQLPLGALMFSCIGRGADLYDAENVDSSILLRYLPPVAVGGFFSNGEIGPIGRNTYLHGYTSVFGLIYERNA